VSDDIAATLAGDLSASDEGGVFAEQCVSNDEVHGVTCIAYCQNLRLLPTACTAIGDALGNHSRFLR